MAQFSFPWPGVAPGDGEDAGPYTAPQWWGRIVALLSGSGMVEATTPLTTSADRNNLGVLVKVGNLLAVTNPANNSIRIDTGAAVVDGAVYHYGEALTLAIPLPVANPRIDRIVIRKNYTAVAYDPAGDAGDEEVPAYTTRITRIVGTESATPTPPALTQDTSRGTYWDIPLAQFRISTAGVITALSDEREFAPGWDDDHHSPNAAYGIYHPLYRNAATDAIQADSGGNARGTEAIDLQQERTANSQVASGTRAVITGGEGNTASGNYSSASNLNTRASGLASHAEGEGSVASGERSHAEGWETTASGDRGAHAEGNVSVASGICAHAEGYDTDAINVAAHAEGGGTSASGMFSHAEGNQSVASGYASHAQNCRCTAEGDHSFAGGTDAKTGANKGVFIWADLPSVPTDFTADRANQFKVRASGGVHFVQSSDSAALPVLELEQDDSDEPFIEFDGTSAADQTKSISTVNGNGTVTGPKNFGGTAGWEFVGMVRVSINGNDFWMPYYQPDTA